MVSKCANPACSATFRYLHEGILFHIAFETAAARAAEDRATPAHERFWLCGECSRKMTVVPTPTGILVVPLQQRSAARKNGIPARPWDSA